MKKTYSKPEIVFDSFSLCTNIAGMCARPTNTPVSGTCPLIIGGRPLFTQDVGACRFKTEDGNPLYDGVCYHVPTDINSLFNS